MKLTTPLAVCAIAVTLVLAKPASAQHADFVLFGDPNPAAKKAPREHRFAHPATSPYYHEDSFNTSDVRLWFLYHDFPKASLLGGGSAKVVAAQLRLAITSQLQLVAYKDGWTDMDTGLTDASGWNDIAAGLKWNFIQDFDNQFHAAIGAGYELSVGDDETFHDDDEWRIWASVNKGFDRLHLGGTLNFFISDDGSQGLGNSDHLSWHLHADYYVCEWFSPIVELNGYHVLNNGREIAPFSGNDVVNLGGSSDDAVVTIGLGAELRPLDNVSLRFAYETPLTDGDDVWGYRWTFGLAYSF